MRASLLALILLAAACAGARVPPPAAPPETVPPADALGSRTIALLPRDGFMLVPTRIDGRDVGEFLIDTGAGAIVVDEQVADQLGLPDAVDTTVAGALAQAQASVREVHTVTAAGLPLEHELVLAVDLGDVNPMRSFAGIIGFPALGPAPFTIDFVRGNLTLHDIARFVPPAGVEAEPLRINPLPYVEATLEGGVAAWLLLDTGQGAPVVLWQEFVKQHPDILTVPQKRWAQATGIGGGRQVMESELRSLRIFGEEHGKTPVLIQEAPKQGWHHPKVAGRIGMALLDRLRLTIHPTHRRIWIERP
jgi:predicted aspartyl protease